MIKLEQIGDSERMNEVRAIFCEYQASIGVDLCFQGFAAELASLPGTYAAPNGRLLLAYVNDACAGCIALRPLMDGGAGQDCEMKRLYVRLNFRGHQIGRLLAERVLQDAREIGYRHIVLDTMSSMHSAQALYRSLGFIEIAPYYVNPLPDISYMRLDLGNKLA
jgi:putative acetyltransferase